MIKNMGVTDRWMYIMIGLAIGGLGIYFKSWWGLLGLIFLSTALISWCPLDLPFGISTRRSN